MNVLKRKNQSRVLWLLPVLLSLSLALNGQAKPDEIHVMFYNAENLFDLKDDPETNDNEFTPDGERHWNYKWFKVKLQNISKVILASAGWKPPEIIGLCEIENNFVLTKLLTETPLSKYPYSVIHKQSPDPRGIDVAMIYNNEIFYPVSYLYYPLRDKNDSTLKTREILHVFGVVNKKDSLHVFYNHWPSRYSGLLESESSRALAAQLLKFKTDSVLKLNPAAKIIIMGDFNDQPDDISLETELGALYPEIPYQPSRLYNLSAPWEKAQKGTHKFQGQWAVFDQVIVSSGILDSSRGYTAIPEFARIADLKFLLERDEQYGGFKPNRTFNGFQYHGGFSDHLPVLLKLTCSPTP